MPLPMPRLPLQPPTPDRGASAPATGERRTLSVCRKAGQIASARTGEIGIMRNGGQLLVDSLLGLGATKAFGERIVESRDRRSNTKFAAVRFGNVLGSSGSVVPIFRQQIAAGGPVTVTDAEMTRYFMTIPEAVQPVIEATGIAEGGDIFVLDMGEPVRIMDLAENMIRLSGREPGRDIAIEVVGIRPGEKLHEELFNLDEQVQPTRYGRILRATRPGLDPAAIRIGIDLLRERVDEGDTTGAADVLWRTLTARRDEAAQPETHST